MTEPAEKADSQPPPSVPTASASAPIQVGRFRLCFEVASGGMATLYLARAEGLDKLVALKRIHPHLAKESGFVDMFRDEARIASLISHPNVCGVFDFGEADGVPYLAMDYLVGEPLSRVLRHAARDPSQQSSPRWAALVSRIVSDACEGLHAAHELRDSEGRALNVVHRDVSPQNLFVTYDGSVRVLDFGIASASHRVHKTRTGELKGKYAYMAPEQLRGKKGATIDRRADVWALGVVLWEALTLRRLFRRETESETLFAVVEDTVLPPSQVSPHVPQKLDAVVMKALARNPDERYATARELGRDLLRYVGTTGEPIGLAELAEWMEKLFPEGKARARQLVELAMQSNATVPRVHRGSTSGESSDVSDVRGIGLDIEVAPTMTGTRLRAANKTRRRLVLLLSLLGVAGLGIWLATLAIHPSSPPRLSPPVQAVLHPAPPRAPVPPPPVVPVVPVDVPEGAPIVAPIAPVVPHTNRHHDRVASPPPPPAVTGTGTVNVVTPGGWALVRMGGRELGQTPGRFTIPAGHQTLQIIPFGTGTPISRAVDVPANGVTRLAVPVTPPG